MAKSGFLIWTEGIDHFLYPNSTNGDIILDKSLCKSPKIVAMQCVSCKKIIFDYTET